jgi:hypothetical protein
MGTADLDHTVPGARPGVDRLLERLHTGQQMVVDLRILMDIPAKDINDAHSMYVAHDIPRTAHP